MLKSNGWSNGGDELETFDDKAETLQGDRAEHDMKEPTLIIQIYHLTVKALHIKHSINSIKDIFKIII